MAARVCRTVADLGFYLFFPHLQGVQMSLQGAPPVKAAVGEHPADLLQGHLQGPVKENLLEEVHLGLAVDAVAVEATGRA